MIRAEIYLAFDYLREKKIVDRLRISALFISILISIWGNDLILYIS
jgi:hypothetical protein